LVYPLLSGTLDQEHDGRAEQHQQFGRMQLTRGDLADLRRHHHAREADQAADPERHAERFVGAAGLADRRPGEERQEDR